MTKVSSTQPRIKCQTDLLSLAHPSELDWDNTAYLLRNQKLGVMQYVYFIGEMDDGAIKIGTANNPIKRLRELQTGNPRRLRIERLIWGDASVERLLHAYFREFMIGGKQHSTTYKAPHRKGTEWFEAEAREQIIAAADHILERQRGKFAVEGAALLGVSSDALCAAVREGMDALGYVLKERERVRLLGSGGGYKEISV